MAPTRPHSEAILTIDPPPRARRAGRAARAHEEEGVEVDRHGAAPGLVRGVFGRCRLEDAGVVDQHVEPAEPLGGRGREAVAEGAVGQVAGDELGLGARGRGPVGDGLAACLVAAGEQQARTRRGEDPGDGRADARASTRHERDLSSELHDPRGPVVLAVRPTILAPRGRLGKQRREDAPAHRGGRGGDGYDTVQCQAGEPSARGGPGYSDPHERFGTAARAWSRSLKAHAR